MLAKITNVFFSPMEDFNPNFNKLIALENQVYQLKKRVSNENYVISSADSFLRIQNLKGVIKAMQDMIKSHKKHYLYHDKWFFAACLLAELYLLEEKFEDALSLINDTVKETENFIKTSEGQVKPFIIHLHCANLYRLKYKTEQLKLKVKFGKDFYLRIIDDKSESKEDFSNYLYLLAYERVCDSRETYKLYFCTNDSIKEVDKSCIKDFLEKIKLQKKSLEDLKNNRDVINALTKQIFLSQTKILVEERGGDAMSKSMENYDKAEKCDISDSEYYYLIVEHSKLYLHSFNRKEFSTYVLDMFLPLAEKALLIDSKKEIIYQILFLAYKKLNFSSFCVYIKKFVKNEPDKITPMRILASSSYEVVEQFKLHHEKLRDLFSKFHSQEQILDFDNLATYELGFPSSFSKVLLCFNGEDQKWVVHKIFPKDSLLARQEIQCYQACKENNAEFVALPKTLDTERLTFEYYSIVLSDQLSKNYDRNNSFSIEEIQRWAIQLSHVLIFFHGVLKILYLDLKPSNILIDNKGNIKLIDMGCCCSIKDNKFPELIKPVGTPIWRTSEMSGANQENPVTANSAQDIFSALKVIFMLLCCPYFPEIDFNDENQKMKLPLVRNYLDNHSIWNYRQKANRDNTQNAKTLLENLEQNTLMGIQNSETSERINPAGNF